jgi:hypothetical protein
MQDLGVLYSTSIKPLSHCYLGSLSRIWIGHCFEYTRERLSKTRVGVSLSPLWRTRVDKSEKSYPQNEFYIDSMLPYDFRDLVKLEWPGFNYPSYYINKKLITYKMTKRQKDAIIRRADLNVEEPDT